MNSNNCVTATFEESVKIETPAHPLPDVNVDVNAEERRISVDTIASSSGKVTVRIEY